MTNRILVFLMLVSLPAPAMADASSGGESGGGGNAIGSTLAQVDALLKGKMWWPDAHNFTFAGIRKAFLPNAVLPIRDAKAAGMLTKLIGAPYVSWSTPVNSPTPFARFTDALKFDYRATGPCLEGSEEKDASMSVAPGPNGPVATMCFSLERLTRYPVAGLQAILPALFVHELAHAHGYSESDAVYIQNYLQDKFSRPCSVSVHFGGGSPDFFYVKIDADSNVDVDYARYLPPKASTQENADRNNKVVVTTRNYLGQAALDWGQGEGRLSFISMNYDGTYSDQSVRWGAFAVETTDVAESYDIQSSDFKANGKKLPVTDLSLYQCRLR